MLGFVLVFLTIYTGMHLLVFWGIHPLLAGHPLLPTLNWIWMGLMILAPLLVRLLERGGQELAARGLAWVGYSWMGFLFIAFSLCVLLAGWELFCWLLGRAWPLVAQLSLHGGLSAGLIVATTLAAGLYGLYEAAHLRVERVTLTSAKLPAGSQGIRIVQLSDLHLGLIHREETLAPIIAQLQQLRPDLLVASGDVVDAQINHLEELTALWQQVNPPLGKFAVTGNHEVYAGMEQALEFLAASGFQVLRNTTAAVTEYLTLVGVDDPAAGPPAAEASLLAQLPGTRFIILLKHRPALDPAARGRFDLQLSGHAHRGQIFPFNYLTGLEYPLQDGLYPLAEGGHLYTSRGTGTWGPPMRILSPPELTVFDIVPEPTGTTDPAK
ncbi:metallophosphoesterase [Desulfuromonas carbonis]|uniref:metallophosphoesterase n=1 Tax=Desulfuromonas sp. DDH964 TaxID=1823759 RepID=UPI00078E3D0A|nr:metallophosphoesterase [Desulfuromonas sp. DDH964]AMV73624.1 putative metallophosphoesterase [Desulfuromonas sp. DDH964]